MRIAQRFNAGLRQEGKRVPEGRPKTGFPSRASAVPPGLWGLQPRDPALKRWAIVECPSGTDYDPNSRKALGLGNTPGIFESAPGKRVWFIRRRHAEELPEKPRYLAAA